MLPLWARLVAGLLAISGAASAAFPDPWYPRYHFRPLKYWNNDPCAPFYHRGWYHLMFIYID